MNRKEHLLSCLAEECTEVGQRVSKALRFGMREVQAGQNLSNAGRIAEELRDLLSVVQILEAENILGFCWPTADEVAAKRAKIERYMEISRLQGALHD